MKKSILWIFLAVVIVIVAGAIYFLYRNTRTHTTTQPTELKGTVMYRERIALPTGSTINVKLQDVSQTDANAFAIATTTIVTKGENVPIAFTLAYDPARIDPRHSYTVSATITVDGKLSWITDSSHAVLTNGNPATDVTLMLKQVTQSVENSHNSGIVACTQDAKQCSDGSYVSRIAPSCDFAACPAH